MDVQYHAPLLVLRFSTAMIAPNPPLLTEVRLGGPHTGQQDLALASEGEKRCLWQSPFGAIRIEVRDGVAFVNGARVMSIAELATTEE